MNAAFGRSRTFVFTFIIYNSSAPSAIAILAKAEIMDEKIVPSEFISEEHLDNHESEIQKLFKMKRRGYTHRGYRRSCIVGNVDWRLKIDEKEPWKSTICELWMGKSRIVKWNFLPSDFRNEIDLTKVSIAKNFMIIGFYGGDEFLFLNLLSKKLFWVGKNALDNKIRYVLPTNKRGCVFPMHLAQWSFGPLSAWGSIEATIILTMHPNLCFLVT